MSRRPQLLLQTKVWGLSLKFHKFCFTNLNTEKWSLQIYLIQIIFYNGNIVVRPVLNTQEDKLEKIKHWRKTKLYLWLLENNLSGIHKIKSCCPIQKWLLQLFEIFQLSSTLLRTALENKVGFDYIWVYVFHLYKTFIGYQCREKPLFHRAT